MRRYIRLISVVFVCSTLALVFFGYLLLSRFNKAVQYTDAVNRTYEVLNRLELLESYTKDAETAQRGYIITKDSAYLKPLFEIQHKIYPLNDTLVKMVKDTLQNNRLIMLKASVQMLMTYINYNLQLEEAADKSILKKNMDRGKRLMDGIRSQIAIIRERGIAIQFARNTTKRDYLASTSTAFISVFCFVALIMVATFILLIIELRKRYRVQLQLQNQIIQLQQFTKESDELSYAISHDLQEPLRKLRIFTDRLFQKHKANLNDEGKEIVQRMNMVAATAQDTMNELLRFTSVIPQVEQQTAIDLNNLLPRIWESVAEKATQKNATIQIDTLPTIKGSEQRVTILFDNLLTNALVFSKEGKPLKITVRSYQTTGQQIKQAASYQRQQVYDAIEISDNGIGFDNNYAVKIFQLFRRLHAGQDKFAGKGIGLAICQRIMSNHNGFVTAKGKAGEGAVFTVYFPAQ